MQVEAGYVGRMFAAGETVLTLSGRKTSPFPKTTPRTRNKADKWLLQNAYDEAVARGDDFNAVVFKRDLECKNVPQASKDSAEMYLFEWQTAVKRSILKTMG